jgi:hypothetical protein
MWYSSTNQLICIHLRYHSWCSDFAAHKSGHGFCHCNKHKDYNCCTVNDVLTRMYREWDVTVMRICWLHEKDSCRNPIFMQFHPSLAHFHFIFESQRIFTLVLARESSGMTHCIDGWKVYIYYNAFTVIMGLCDCNGTCMMEDYGQYC